MQYQNFHQEIRNDFPGAPSQSTEVRPQVTASTPGRYQGLPTYGSGPLHSMSQNRRGLPLPRNSAGYVDNLPVALGAMASSPLQDVPHQSAGRTDSSPTAANNAPSSSLPILANLASQMPRQVPVSPQSSSGEAESNGSYGDIEEPNGRPPKAKRAQVKNACVHCQKACKRCSQERPCQRCTKYGYSDCVDSPRKARQRGIKRGPYKRKGEYNPLSHSHAWQGAQQRPPVILNGHRREGHLQLTMVPHANGHYRTDSHQMPFAPVLRNPVPMYMAQQWLNRDHQLQAHIAALPLATPLKGSPTATPVSGRQLAHRPPGPAHQQTESAILANMHSLYSTPPSGNSTPALAQNQTLGFANHAQLLRAKLSPLVTLENGGSGGLSRAMDPLLVSPGPVPATAGIESEGDKESGTTRLPFMGHASTAPSSPTGLRTFFDIEDMLKFKPFGRTNN